MCAELGGELMRRRVMHILQNLTPDVLYPLENGTFTSLDNTIVAVSNENHIYAKSSEVGGVHYVWLSPQVTEWYTAYNTFSGNKIYPTNVLFSLKIGDTVKFVIKNNNTGITNKWQNLYVAFASGTTEKVVSGYFQQKTELTTEVTVTENIDVTALSVHISRYSTEAEFDLEVYVNGVRYF